MSIKTKLDVNLVFIWEHLMSARARSYAIRSVILVLCGSAVLTAAPYGVGYYIDGLTTTSTDLLLTGAVLFLLLEVSNIIFGWFRQRVRERFFQAEFWYLPQSITRMYFSRPLSFLTERDSEIDGGGVESLRDKTWHVIGAYIFQIVPNLGAILFGAAACLLADWRIGLIVVVYVALEYRISKSVNAHIQQEMIPVIDGIKRWDRRMQEWWRSTDHVKYHGVETKLLRQVHDEVQESLRGDDAVWRIYFNKVITTYRIRSLIIATLLYGLVGYLVMDKAVSLASGVLIFFSVERIRTVLAEINDIQRDVQSNLASIAKYRRVLIELVPHTYHEGENFTESEISIVYDRVFHLVGESDSKQCILRDVSLEIAAGEHVGIVGPSGAGKSQLMSLLVRACDPESGRVLISGHDLRDLRTESLLRYYGVIMQKSEPFEDTVLGNMLFGVSHLDLPVPYAELSSNEQTVLQEKALVALEKSGLDVDRFPSGIMANIGYKGMKLSPGMQQRLQIAAAHFKLSMSEKRPRLILADEPTASLDSLSETTVMSHLNTTLPAGTTMLMVAHRLSTVASMDRIIFVRPLEICCDGQAQVTTHGSLAELYQAEALFREMADAQSFCPE